MANTHVLWGVGGLDSDHPSQTAALENNLGRKFGVIRRYSDWDTDLPTADMKQWIDSGHVVYTAWSTYYGNGQVHKFSEVADTNNSTIQHRIREQAANIKNAGAKYMNNMIFTFHHEPSTQQASDKPQPGPAADYVAAFSNVRQIFNNAGVVFRAWTITQVSANFGGGTQDADDWTPSPKYWDYVGVDTYVRGPVDGSHLSTFAEKLKPVINWANGGNKYGVVRPVLIGELGYTSQSGANCTPPYPSGGETNKANWISASTSYMKGNPAIEVVCWTYGRNDKGTDCFDWREDTSNTVFNAWQAQGNDAWFKATSSSGTSPTAPSAPIMRSVAPPAGTTQQLKVNWDASLNDGGSPITGYNVWRRKAGDVGFVHIGTLPTVNASTTNYTNLGLQSGTQYDYHVTAVNAVGDSQKSATLGGVPN